MSEKIRYTNEPLGRLKVVPDFLPRPEDLARKPLTARSKHFLARVSQARRQYKEGKYKTLKELP